MASSRFQLGLGSSSSRPSSTAATATSLPVGLGEPQSIAVGQPKPVTQRTLAAVGEFARQDVEPLVIVPRCRTGQREQERGCDSDADLGVRACCQHDPIRPRVESVNDRTFGRGSVLVALAVVPRTDRRLGEQIIAYPAGFAYGPRLTLTVDAVGAATRPVVGGEVRPRIVGFPDL